MLLLFLRLLESWINDYVREGAKNTLILLEIMPLHLYYSHGKSTESLRRTLTSVPAPQSWGRLHLCYHFGSAQAVQSG